MAHHVAPSLCSIWDNCLLKCRNVATERWSNGQRLEGLLSLGIDLRIKNAKGCQRIQWFTVWYSDTGPLLSVVQSVQRPWKLREQLKPAPHIAGLAWYTWSSWTKDQTCPTFTCISLTFAWMLNQDSHGGRSSPVACIQILGQIRLFYIPLRLRCSSKTIRWEANEGASMEDSMLRRPSEPRLQTLNKKYLTCDLSIVPAEIWSYTASAGKRLDLTPQTSALISTACQSLQRVLEFATASHVFPCVPWFSFISHPCHVESANTWHSR